MNANITYRPFKNQAYWPLRETAASSEKSGLKAQLGNLLQTLFAQCAGSSDPHVWTAKDAEGQTVWNAQDVVSGKVIRNVSESEMRVWLEERYRF